MSETHEAEKLDRELANSNLNRAAGLIGSSMAIFTFVLFFLYPRYSDNRIDPILFQITLTMITLTVFAFGFSGLQYYGVIGTKTGPAEKGASRRRGDLFFVLGLVIATGEPALILYTIGLATIAIVATILWLLYAYSLIQQGRRFEFR